MAGTPRDEDDSGTAAPTATASPRALREAFGTFATGVTVVTAFDAESAPRGFTANSFTSVSLDPPMVLVCVGRGSQSGVAVRNAGRFAVNILGERQIDIAQRFAAAGVDRFADIAWSADPAGVPVISGAIAHFVCETESVIAAADHDVLLARVLGFVTAPGGALGYFRSRYIRVAPPAPAKSDAADQPARPLRTGWVPPAPPAPVTLEGRHVRLTPLGLADAAPLHAAFGTDAGLWRFMSYGPFADAAAYADWVGRMASRPDPLFFALTDRRQSTPAGVASLLNIVPAHGTIEVGHICLAPSLQRSTAATEAISLLARHVFGAGFRRFEWKCDSRNLASRRAAQRLGFSFEGVFRNHMVIKGQSRDTAWFAITDAEWPALRAAHDAWLDPANFDAQGRQRSALGTLTAPLRVASDPALF
jgi:flavin reductase (DIM6/NTAB) family NADH-FMN oxidoreductase RutF/RimJ/RimL family protein N-acetyltransferase